MGIATQREELREKYFGTPEMLVTFLTHVGQEVRDILAELGYERLEDVIGRADLLQQIPAVQSERWRGVDLSKLLARPEDGPLSSVQERNDRPGTPLDERIIHEMNGALENGTPFIGVYEIRNTDRTVGGRISGRIARIHGVEGLPPGTVELRFQGSAGQSFGAWLVNGVSLGLVGEANDYVGKGMNGGEIAIRAPDDAGFVEDGGTLVGNTVLYGATGGHLFVAGRAGERFAVRNSGALAVVEGVGDHGCEYMTEGVVVILGTTGRNFGAGMSGGVAYVLDGEGDFNRCLNPELVAAEALVERADKDLLRTIVERHYERTNSAIARELLEKPDVMHLRFVKVSPRFAPGDESELSLARRHLEQLEVGAAPSDAVDGVESPASRITISATAET